MARIDLFWDAFEDCLCKAELRAEFDRLKSERNALDGSLKAAKQESDRYVNIAYDNMIARDEARAEKETIEASRQAYIKILDETMLENEELQSHLDTICEPIRTDGDIGYIKRTVIPLLYEQCKTISAQTLERVLAYLDSQKPSEKPLFYKEPFDKEWHRQNHAGSGYSFEDCHICNPLKHLCNDGIWEYIPKSECQRCSPLKCEHKNLSGGTDCLKGKRCLDCGEWTGKLLTQCPGCIWGQKKVQYERKCLDYPYTQFYFVYERCPRCRGGGRI